MEEENKRYKVIVTPTAAQMLQWHAAFLAQVSPTAALKLIEEFENTTKSLSHMPGRHPFLSDPAITAGRYRRVGLGKWLLMIYQIKGDTVYIDSVIDCRQDYSWLSF